MAKPSALPPATQKFIQHVLATYKLRITRVDRNGPRFFVAAVTQGQRRLLFKTCVQVATKDRWSNLKFSREVRWLTYVANSHHRAIKQLVPGIVAGGSAPRAWYLREYLSGTFYNINGGNIRYRPTFFTADHVQQITAAIADLHRIRPGELPADFRRMLKRVDTIGHALSFLKPFWPRIASILHDRAAASDLPKILQQFQPPFDASPSALSHHEPYASHFVRVQGRLRLIDWENINWANPLNDYTAIWMRAAATPKWQQDLYRIAEKQAGSWHQSFPQVWQANILIKSIYTILSFPTYADQADMKGLASISRHIINQALKEFHAK